MKTIKIYLPVLITLMLLPVLLKQGQTKVEVDAADLTKGIYFYSIIKEGVILETRKIVKN